MFDIMAAAFAATTPGPDLAESPGLKPKRGAFLCPGMGSQSPVAGLDGWGALYGGMRAAAALLTTGGPGLARLCSGWGKGWAAVAPQTPLCPAPACRPLGPSRRCCLPTPCTPAGVNLGVQSECILLPVEQPQLPNAQWGGGGWGTWTESWIPGEMSQIQE